MTDAIPFPSQPSRMLSAHQPNPGLLDLAALVELLTIVPLDANTNLRKVVSVKMDVREILFGKGEQFEIAYSDG